jgi:hypothetical protein
MSNSSLEVLRRRSLPGDCFGVGIRPGASGVTRHARRRVGAALETRTALDARQADRHATSTPIDSRSARPPLSPWRGISRRARSSTTRAPYVVTTVNTPSYLSGQGARHSPRMFVTPARRICGKLGQIACSSTSATCALGSGSSAWSITPMLSVPSATRLLREASPRQNGTAFRPRA